MEGRRPAGISGSIWPKPCSSRTPEQGARDSAQVALGALQRGRLQYLSVQPVLPLSSRANEWLKFSATPSYLQFSMLHSKQEKPLASL